MSTEPQSTDNDGRRARSERSREAIKKAMVDLMNEGVREPTAQLVCDKAGVGIRSVFRHFEDMESLFVSIHEDLKTHDVELMASIKTSGPIEERLESLLDIRGTLYKKYRDIILSTLGLMWKHHSLKKNYADLNNIFRAQMFDCLHELKTASEDQKALAEMLLSFESWNRMIRHQNVAPETVRALVKSEILKLIAAQS